MGVVSSVPSHSTEPIMINVMKENLTLLRFVRYAVRRHGDSTFVLGRLPTPGVIMVLGVMEFEQLSHTCSDYNPSS